MINGNIFAVLGFQAARVVVLLLISAFLLQPVSFIYADEGEEENAPAPAPVAEEVSPKSEPEPEPEPVEEEVKKDVEVEEEVKTEDVSGDVVANDDGSKENQKAEVVLETENADNTTNENAVSDSDISDNTETSEDNESKEVAVEKDAENEVGSSATTTTEIIPKADEDELGSTTPTTTDTAKAGASGGGGEDKKVYEEVLGTTTTNTISSTTPTTTESIADIPDQDTATTTEIEAADEKETEETKEGEVLAATTTPVAPVATTTPATTTPQIVYVAATGTATNAQNRHQFAESECVHVGDGAFYCAKNEESEEMLEDEVYSAPDKDGDYEIFVRINGDVEQITDNVRDDSAPYYDEVGKRIVWHALENDRYQIFSFDLKGGETRQLTNESYNNMEPTAYGDITLWQAWVGNDWEIMLDVDGEITQLTNNAYHDVAPHVRGDYIVWQAQVAGTWFVKIYDMETETIETIEGDGSLIENPRFLLVYDSTKENGDTETIGYDLKSKKTVPLSRVPTSVPEELPDPERTGEERALLNTKTQASKELLDDSDDDTDGNADPKIDPKNATSTKAAAATTGSTDVVIPSIQNKDIDSKTTTTATSTGHIDDMVIPAISNRSEDADIEAVVDHQIAENDPEATSTRRAEIELREGDVVVPTFAQETE